MSDENRELVRQTWSGTHTGGEFMGVPSTGKTVSVGVIDIISIAGGRFVEHWGQMDSMGMMQQLGAGPTPPSKTG